jgi:hypothetical protein
MAFGRILLAWMLVAVWLYLWAAGERRMARAGSLPVSAILPLAGEALLLALFAALWFGSLGAGGWWLLFGLLGALMEWPIRTGSGAARILRIVGAGALLAWRLGP